MSETSEPFFVSWATFDLVEPYPLTLLLIGGRHVWEHINVVIPYLANTEHDTLYSISYCLLPASAAFDVIIEDI